MKKPDETSNTDSYFTTKINSLRQGISEAKDYPLYDEVVKCLSGGANRAAYILTWICIAESLRNKFVAMSTRDAEIGKILAKIKEAEQNERSTDRILLDNAAKVGIISSEEQIKLGHIRVMRNIYAHPTGSAPNVDEVLAALTVGVDIVLGRPPLLRHGYIDNLLQSLFQDYHFLDDVPKQIQGFAKGVANRVHPEVRSYFVKNLIAHLEQTFDDPALAIFRRRGLEFGTTILRIWRSEFSRANWDLVNIIQKYPHASSTLLCDDKIWKLLPQQAKDMVFGHLCEPMEDGKPQHPTSTGLQRLKILDSRNILNKRQSERLQNQLQSVPYNVLKGAGFPLNQYIHRIIEDLKSHNWYIQNPACEAVSDAGFDACNELNEAIQEELGRNILQAADGDAIGAKNMLNELLGKSGEKWPRAFVRGLLLETLVNERGSFRIKRKYFSEALTIACINPKANDILKKTVHDVQKSKPESFRTNPKDCDYVVNAIGTISNSLDNQETLAALGKLKTEVSNMKRIIKEEIDAL